MANDNKNLHKANKSKKDEFYTQLSDIENELRHYKASFGGKTVLCNCDDPYESNFVKYFAMNFNTLGLKKLIATSYATSPVVYTQLSFFGEDVDTVETSKKPYVIEITEVTDLNGDGAIDLQDFELMLKKNPPQLLKGDGDFRSDECIEFLKEADIVVTNPPFSLFREYVAQLIEYDKKFLIIGNQNAITYKEIFPLIKDNKMWLGAGDCVRWFIVPETMPIKSKTNYLGERIAEGARSRWFTNIEHKKRYEDLILYKKYTPEEYPKYDNYDAINVDKVADIPCDYFEDMGVPITFLDKYNPEQFDIVKFRKGNDEKDLTYTVEMCDNLLDETRRDETRKENYALLQNHYQTEDVMVLLEFQLLSSISTTLNSLKLSELPKVKEKDSQMDCGTQKVELLSQLSTENESTSGYLSNGKCNGVMGVPITFLDKYNPEQFEIVGRADANIAFEENKYHISGYKDKGGAPLINGKFVYKRILIKRKK